MRRVSILILVAALVVSAPMFGQAQRGTITVEVISAEDGSAIPGATVSATSPDTLSRRVAISDARGRALLVSLDPADTYTVTVELQGFNGARFEQTSVRAGQDTSLAARLSLESIAETLVVVAESPIVDVTSAIAGQEITLQLTESLPTARTYQDYLQLVPGVQDDIDSEGNPASRSGVNYRDVAVDGQVGRSTDNEIYFDGINTTDHVTGTFGANLNTEIIQEQSVLTGGIPAEFVGAPGLIANVVTKSGGNQFSGSVNYYFQNDSLVADNEHFEDQTFSRFDTAVTLGGPLVQDRAWFFGSYRIVNREDDVVDAAGSFLRTVENEGDQAFGKITWSITDSDLLSGVFLSDPAEITGQRDNTLSNAEDFSRDAGGERWTLNYNRAWKNVVLEAGLYEHEGDLNDSPRILEPQNRVSFEINTPRGPDQEALGGDGDLILETRGNEGQRLAVELLLDSGWGDHAIKVGADLGESSQFEDEQFVGDAQWTSLDNQFAGVNLFQVDGTTGDGFSLQEFTSDNQDSITGFNQSLQTHTQRAAILASLDSDGDGFVSGPELGANMVFNDTTGNPNGKINYARDLQVSSGAREVNSEFASYYVQDSWQYGRWSANVGVRFEQFEHFAANGDQIIKFDTEIAPRVSLAYDLKGNGRQRLSFYFGRYYDAIRNNMTDFAGSNLGRVIEEQVWVDAIGDYVSFRTRGGAVQLDGFFAPSIQVPYTDELQIGYKVDLGRSMSFEANLIDRETQDIMEDFSPFEYFQPAAYPGPINDPDSLFLGPGYLGFDTLPAANFFIATLPSAAFRDYRGVELIFRKRFSDNWQTIASYNFADQEGNSVSDSTADLAGDVLWLDPRAPNVTGTLPGLVEHLFKVAGSYSWDNGFQAGAAYRWNSGVHLNTTGALLFDRSVPVRVAAPFAFAGINNQRWLDEGVVGAIESDAYGSLDLRGSYLWNVTERMEVDVFVDVFNALDQQDTTRIQDVVGGANGVAFGEGVTFVDPRRFFLGARLRF
jgi:hypothetical protein